MASKNTIKIPYGERQGHLVHVSDVERGIACGCVCPECGERLVARKGTTMAAHFGHYTGARCNPETALHSLGKRLLSDRLRQAIATGSPVPMNWRCSACFDDHSGDLVRTAASVEVESPVGPCRPDLLLRRADGGPIAFVEIVVTHEPEPSVKAFAREARIAIVEFQLRSGEDLEQLATGNPLIPSKIDLCTRPKCPVCVSPMERRTVHVVTDDCWKCKEPMKVAVVSGDHGMEGPEYFTPTEIAMASSQGAVLKMQFSKTIRSRYLANTCLGCGAFMGSFYLHEIIDLLYDSEGHDAGHLCRQCRDGEDRDESDDPET